MKPDALQCDSARRLLAFAQVIAAHLWRARLVRQAVPEAHLVGDAAQVVVAVVVAAAVAVVVVALLAVVVVTLLTWVLAALLTVVDETLLAVVKDTLLAIVVVTQIVAVAGLGQALLEVAEVAVDCARGNGALVGC